MPTGEVAPGQARAWNLLTKLGEGDAGEVYLVEALLDRRVAILKRPRRSAFTSDIVRQASQIAREAEILKALHVSGILNNRTRTPELLDQSRLGSEYSERFFIVISQADGLDLNSLARLAHYGKSALEDSSRLPVGMNPQFIEQITRTASLPPLLVLRAMLSVLEFLESIHATEGSSENGDFYGILWNDIKPDHIFWDPQQAQLTLIDWGNAQFLESDGSTKDRQFSRIDDFSQYIESFGRYLQAEFPSLYSQLEWPENLPPTRVHSVGILPLKERLARLVYEENRQLDQARQEESRLGKASAIQLESLDALELAQQQITAFGELPDYAIAEKFVRNLAETFVASENYDDFWRLCRQIESIPTLPAENWSLFIRLAELAKSETIRPSTIKAGIANEWDVVFWELRLAALSQPEPDWWIDLRQRIRTIYLPEVNSDTPSPLVALNRLVHALQTMLQVGHSNSSERNQPQPDLPENGSSGRQYQYESLYRTLKEEVLPRWTQMEPDPPNSGIEYSEVERLFGEILDLKPDAGNSLVRSLDQARAQAQITIDAWNAQDFELARRGLRRILLWDPERLRLLLADHTIQRAPAWLSQVRQGPDKDEPLSDFVTRLSLDGRELRHMVGPAIWLDAILEAFTRMRKGADPTQVLISFPDLRTDLSWLLEIDPRRPLLASLKPVKLERSLNVPTIETLSYGMRESSFGTGTEFILAEALDTWAAEARGSSARVYLGYVRGNASAPQPTAVKIMRPGKADYALPLFQEEARIFKPLARYPRSIAHA